MEINKKITIQQKKKQFHPFQQTFLEFFHWNLDKMDKVETLDKVNMINRVDNVEKMEEMDKVDKSDNAVKVDRVDKEDKVNKKILNSPSALKIDANFPHKKNI